MNTLIDLLQSELLIRIVNVIVIFFLAWMIYRLSRWFAGILLRFYEMTISSRPIPDYLDRFGKSDGAGARLAHLNEWLPAELTERVELREERHQTLQGIIASTITVFAVILAVLASIGQFVPQSSVVALAGILITAFAFAGRTTIGDYIAGLGILFQDLFYVGEKIKVKAQTQLIEGVVERVSLNSTWLRARTGELYVVSNGEMRFICNYSRGIYSSANVTIKIAAADLNRALPLLRDLADEAVELLDDLKEPWQVISESGIVAEHVELTLAVRAYFGHAVSLRPQLLALVQQRLAQADITLVS